jgi:hypothetical protein
MIMQIPGREGHADPGTGRRPVAGDVVDEVERQAAEGAADRDPVQACSLQNAADVLS